MKHLGLIAVFIVFYTEVNSQSVVQQCLTEQLRNNTDNNNNNFNAANQQQQQSVELATLSAFQSICGNYAGYIECFQNRLWGSNDASDLFLSLMFQPQSMTIAYRGLCHNLDAIEQNIQCLLSTPEVQRCYDNFNEGVQRVTGLQTQGQLPRDTLQEMACNVSVSRYQCETAVYRFCDERSGQVMQDFFFAGVPQQCRDTTGVTSPFVDLWGGAAGVTGSRPLYVIAALATVSIVLWRDSFL
ncbi:uncharacterized protein LOC143299169 [Babylonia areolata]|uniref:uncharacterized protein LOC143299169 n=1 Tax=Babylonia areolata TaxID=304850 RepID=UPI003FD0CF24